MAQTQAIRLAGSPIGLSVTGSSHTAQTITPSDASGNALEFTNTSSTLIVYVNAICVTQASETAAAAVVPTDGAAGSEPIPPNQSKVIQYGPGPWSVTAIGSGAGPTLLVATPVTTL